MHDGVRRVVRARASRTRPPSRGGACAAAGGRCRPGRPRRRAVGTAVGVAVIVRRPSVGVRVRLTVGCRRHPGTAPGPAAAGPRPPGVALGLRSPPASASGWSSEDVSGDSGWPSPASAAASSPLRPRPRLDRRLRRRPGPVPSSSSPGPSAVTIPGRYRGPPSLAPSLAALSLRCHPWPPSRAVSGTVPGAVPGAAWPIPAAAIPPADAGGRALRPGRRDGLGPGRRRLEHAPAAAGTAPRVPPGGRDPLAQIAGATSARRIVSGRTVRWTRCPWRCAVIGFSVVELAVEHSGNLQSGSRARGTAAFRQLAAFRGTPAHRTGAHCQRRPGRSRAGRTGPGGPGRGSPKALARAASARARLHRASLLHLCLHGYGARDTLDPAASPS